MADPLRPSISKLARPAQQDGMLGELQSEVAAEATPMLSFVLAHIRTIIGVIVLVVVVVCAVGLWHWQTARSEQSARLELGRMLTSLEGADRLAALEKFSAPSSMKIGMQLEMADAALEAKNPKKAAECYGAIHAADSTSVLGFMAALNQADILRQAGQPAEALKVLDSLLNTMPQDKQKYMAQAIRESQAVAAEEAGQPAQALAAYEAITKESGAADLGFYQAKINELKTHLDQPQK